MSSVHREIEAHNALHNAQIRQFYMQIQDPKLEEGMSDTTLSNHVRQTLKRMRGKPNSKADVLPNERNVERLLEYWFQTHVLPETGAFHHQWNSRHDELLQHVEATLDVGTHRHTEPLPETMPPPDIVTVEDTKHNNAAPQYVPDVDEEKKVVAPEASNPVMCAIPAASASSSSSTDGAGAAPIGVSKTPHHLSFLDGNTKSSADRFSIAAAHVQADASGYVQRKRPRALSSLKPLDTTTSSRNYPVSVYEL